MAHSFSRRTENIGTTTPWAILPFEASAKCGIPVDSSCTQGPKMDEIRFPALISGGGANTFLEDLSTDIPGIDFSRQLFLQKLLGMKK